MSKYFKVGQIVKVANENDNECYEDFKNDRLKIVAKFISVDEHLGYDECMDGMPIYERNKTATVLDNRVNEYMDKAFIDSRGISWFLNLEDLKETLNWNLNGDSSKYIFKWETDSEGIAYIFH